MAIHIYLGGRSGGKSVAKDAGFDKREYSPREFNRLQGEIDEVQAKIKATKSPFTKKDLEQVLAKLKAEQGKYRTDDANLKDLQFQLTQGEAPPKLQEAYNGWCKKQDKVRTRPDSAAAFMVLAAGRLSQFGVNDKGTSK